jgi:hypothetical protein
MRSCFFCAAKNIESAELTVAIQAKHARREDGDGGVEPVARQLHVGLKAVALVLSTTTVYSGNGPLTQPETMCWVTARSVTLHCSEDAFPSDTKIKKKS